MTNIAVLGFFLTLLITLSMGEAAVSQQRAQFTEASVVARSVALYGAKAAQYSRANPTYAGTAGDSALALPSYYVKFPGTSHLISGGRAYVFISGLRPDIRGYVYREMAKDGGTVGYASANRLTDPAGLDLGPLPAGVPAGAVVAVL